MHLVQPAREHLASYRDALERGFSPNNVDPERVRREHLTLIAEEPDALLARMTDPDANGPEVRMADGSTMPRLPGLTRWGWDEDGFCGSINLRWPKAGETLPAHVPGHIGFAVPEWKRRRGYASAMLAATLDEARERGLDAVELVAQPDNPGSCRTIERLGGVAVGRFDSGDLHHACQAAVLYRIAL